MTRLLLIFIVGWYICSITLSVYNKWMFDPTKQFHIPYPILVTSFHQFSLWIIAFLYMSLTGIERDKSQTYNSDGTFNWVYYLKFIVPTAVATAGDIGFSNESLEYVPLTVYTIVKSSSIAFVLLFGCIFKLERFHWKLAIIVTVMFTGVVIMVYDPSGNKENAKRRHNILLGSFFVLIGSCLSGLRWVFTQLVLRYNEGNKNYEIVASNEITIETDDTASVEENFEKISEKLHPIHTIYELAPVMAIVLFITSLFLETPFPGLFNLQIFKVLEKTENNEIWHTTALSVFKGILLLVIPGFLVFGMTICEFGILQISKVLTLSVAGIVKEVLTIIFGILILGEKIKGWHCWVGMIIILCDVSYYNYFRYNEKIEEASSSNDNTYNNDDEEENIQFRTVIDYNKKSDQEQDDKLTSAYSIVLDPSSKDIELDDINNDIIDSNIESTEDTLVK
ncbi:hypothetical protein Kpol_1004p60 [Vanderwaltozyma polyspora DSM 70294]|uniref:GDP-mannose transporter n=1 Tax=Vanderwaltozyma polyspora (strain ATCC 22028 / DSM 70294 / BCRC 21397 / CBS 2163 / NBRC 10782 / NRRL Y-8283 / UCD 57-17) TaxID=436907 RepID=A7TJB4_VANPO|nr:uncharacterized protein Kpol_1004p60 [Vanderwaltozyma polyspora DSM 70294]EDO17683.1 hypothetical protein Kpol_1004p60 [Vanderwaltozyma polyspora DSM 70294]